MAEAATLRERTRVTPRRRCKRDCTTGVMRLAEQIEQPLGELRAGGLVSSRGVGAHATSMARTSSSSRHLRSHADPCAAPEDRELARSPGTCGCPPNADLLEDELLAP